MEQPVLASVNDIPFVDVCRIFDSISDPLKKPNEKIQILGHFLSQYLSSPDLFSLFRLILPQIDRQRGIYNMKEAMLARLYADVFGFPKIESDRLKHYKDPQYLEGTKARSGDFSSVVYCLLQPRLGPIRPVLTIRSLNETLDELQKAETEFNAKRNIFAKLAREATASEHRWITRIILKDMKFGISHERIFKVLHPDASAIYSRCVDLKELLETIRTNAVVPKSSAEQTSPAPHPSSSVTLFRPFLPMLAQRVNPPDLESLFTESPVFVLTRQGDESVAPVYLLEPKFDGERLLCHIDRTGREPKIEFYTRRSNNYTHIYGPPLGQMIIDNVKGQKAILDGEVVAWSNEKNDFIPFGSNKTVAMGNLPDASLCYVVFDVLYFANQQSEFDLTPNSAIERREFLNRIITPVPNRFVITPWRKVTKVDEIRKELQTVVQQKREGLILKNVNSTYKLNARKAGWFKLKPTHGSLSDTLDLLVIGGYFGDSARRRDHDSTHIVDHLSVFLCAVISAPNDDPQNVKAVSFCKIGTGYSFSELSEMRALLRPHVSRYLGPSSAPFLGPTFRFGRTERPDIIIDSVNHGFIMEVEAAEIVESSAFEMGWTLRFPRAVNPIRKDKCWMDAMTVQELETLITETRPTRGERHPLESINSDLGIKQEEERVVVVDSEEEVGDFHLSKRRKKMTEGTVLNEWDGTRRSRGLMLEFQGAKLSEIDQVSDIFEGLQFTVMAGEYRTSTGVDHSKASLQRLIKSYGGGVTEKATKGSNSLYIVAPGPDFRTRALLDKYNLPVIHFRYILDCIGEGELLDLRPMYLVHATPDLKQQFDKYFDSFGDSFFEPTTPDQLSQLLDIHRENLPLCRHETADRKTDDRQMKSFALHHSNDGDEEYVEQSSEEKMELDQKVLKEQELKEEIRMRLTEGIDEQLIGQILRGFRLYLHRSDVKFNDRSESFDQHVKQSESSDLFSTAMKTRLAISSVREQLEELLQLKIRLKGGRFTKNVKTATHAFAPYFDEENQTIFSEIIHLFQICGGPENGVDVPTDDVFEDRPLVLSNSTYYKELANQGLKIIPSLDYLE